MNLKEKMKQIKPHVQWLGFTVVLLVQSLLIGCSNREIYDNVQMNQRQECRKLPPGQYEDCTKFLRESYDSYELKRRALEERSET